jgi:hypothetical protein
MEFKLISNIVGNIIKTVENTAVVSVKSIKSHTFKTEVTNLPKVQKIEGKVSVVNQVDSLIKQTNRALKDLDQSIKAESKLKREVSVSNPTKEADLKILEQNTFKTYDILKTVIKNVQSLHKPLEALKTVEVSNQPTKELKEVSKGIRELQDRLSKMDFSPIVNVAPSTLPPVNVPPAKVTVEQIEIDYQTLAETLAERLFSGDSKEYLSVRLSDGSKFYKAIENLILEGQGGGKSYAYRDSGGNFAHGNLDPTGNVLTSNDGFVIQDLEDAQPLYAGSVARDGRWRILRLVNDSEIRYATGTTDYLTNWTNRASLTYGYLY